MELFFQPQRKIEGDAAIISTLFFFLSVFGKRAFVFVSTALLHICRLILLEQRLHKLLP